MIQRSQDAPRGRKARISAIAAAVSTLVAVLVLIPGCDDGVPGSGVGNTIERERFVGVMVELRVEAVRSPMGRISSATRDRILAEFDVVEDDLRSWVEVHGRNVPLMTEVWGEVQQRLAERLGVTPEELDPAEALEYLPDPLP